MKKHFKDENALRKTLKTYRAIQGVLLLALLANLIGLGIMFSAKSENIVVAVTSALCCAALILTVQIAILEVKEILRHPKP